MERVKWGILGLGWFGEKHAEALSGIPTVELHSMCRRSEEPLKQTAAEFGVPNTYTDYNEMLADPELQVVSVTTMWDQHVAPAVAALEAGKHVFLEKPMASTVADCRTIVDAANASDRYFMVGHICRFNPRYAAAKREIEAGNIGEVVSAYARRNIPAFVGATVLPKIGPIIGDGVHDMDLILWYTGAKVVSAYAQTHAFNDYANPDSGWSMFRLDTGATVVLENNWCLPDGTAFQIDERIEIIGTKGSIHVHETHPNFSVCKDGAFTSPDTTYWPELHGIRAGALRDELNYFATCVLLGQKPSVITPEESMAAVEACLAAEEAARTGQVVYLNK